MFRQGTRSALRFVAYKPTGSEITDFKMAVTVRVNLIKEKNKHIFLDAEAVMEKVSVIYVHRKL